MDGNVVAHDGADRQPVRVAVWRTVEVAVDHLYDGMLMAGDDPGVRLRRLARPHSGVLVAGVVGDPLCDRSGPAASHTCCRPCNSLTFPRR
jgi:hypothetical protein